MSKEYPYKAGHKQDSPDILVGHGTQISTVIECKAVKMGFADKFAEAEYVGRGYDEVAKAVFQIWRFVSHCRQGLTKHGVTARAVGVVLLLDSWMTMVLNAREEVLSRAEVLRARSSDIIDLDCVQIAFIEIGDLESFAFNGENEFDDGLRDVSSGDHQDWLLTSTPAYHEREKSELGFPFSDLETVVPWWGRVSAMVGTNMASDS